MEYTDAQRAAIGTLDEPLLIVACAGSGKTQVISERIVEILRRPGVEPKNIVAFTFTEKAAAELKERVTSLTTAAFPDMTGLAELFIGTMHGYARDLLQTYVPLTFKRNVLSDIQTRLFIDRHSRASGLTVTDAVVNGEPKKLRRFVNSPLWMQVLGILREDDVDETLLPPPLIAARDGYRRLLAEKNYFDFTELLRVAVDLLGEDADDEIAGPLVRHVRDHVRYVVVDEYQDTNPIQEKLIERLCRFGANLCVVGDDDQTIYQWRGSAVSNILTFAERKAGVQTVTLDENFRSSQGIVALGRDVAALNDPDRLSKNMVAAGHQPYERGDMLALAFDSATDESAWICDRIARLRGMPFIDSPDAPPRGLSWSDFAVLFRSVSKDADALVAELRRRSIPYVIKGLSAAVRCARGTGLRRLLPVHLAGGLGRRRRSRVDSRPMSASRGLRLRRRCRSWRRHGTGSRASAGAPITSSAPTCGSSKPSASGRRRCRRSATTPGPPRGASWSSTTSASSARRSPTSSRFTSSPRRRRSTTRS